MEGNVKGTAAKMHRLQVL